jgi:ribonuclease Y
VKRLEKLESIADSFQGVSKAFALQAGREIRIVVESDQRQRRGDGVALEGHRQADRERARVSRPDQGHRYP